MSTASSPATVIPDTTPPPLPLPLEGGFKRNSMDDLSLSPKRPKTNTEHVEYFHDTPEAEDAVDFAMDLLAREQQFIPQEPTLQFSVVPHRESIGLTSNEFVGQVCATVKARELPDGDAFARASVDVVVALDVSGSMRVEKLDLCKKTLCLLLRELHNEDRFGLISFSDEARIEVPVQKVNEENKRLALHTIEHLSVRGRTNIASAISLASQMANSVTNPNKVRSVFLLTDGNANSGFTDAKDLIELTSIFVEKGHNPHTPPITLHTFGYGPEPDQKLLMDMAKVTSGGSFYSVRDNAQVASAFGDAIGGILSVVAQDVILTISIPEEAAKYGAEIISVHHDKKKELPNGAFQINLGDIYAEESRDIIFEVALMAPTKTSQDDPSLGHALVELSYMDTIKHCYIGPLTCTANISRPSNNLVSWPNRYVAVQWMRVRTAKAISAAEELAKLGNIDEAKASLSKWMTEFNRESFEVAANEDPLIVQLGIDLKECLEVLKDKNHNVFAENELGVRMQAHLSQRCSEPITGKRNVYRTGQKSLRAQSFKKGSGSTLTR
mmetsp:Transcript_20745/g.43574  ORF Transcript_20745/g.43574 Transcript_20745/m.43574 type:complete len:554 (+) Transcript_20745:44-1705(+)